MFRVSNRFMNNNLSGLFKNKLPAELKQYILFHQRLIESRTQQLSQLDGEKKDLQTKVSRVEGKYEHVEALLRQSKEIVDCATSELAKP